MINKQEFEDSDEVYKFFECPVPIPSSVLRSELHEQEEFELAIALSRSEEDQHLYEDLCSSMAECSTHDEFKIICNRCSIVFEWFDAIDTIYNCHSCSSVFCEECTIVVADRNGYEYVRICESCNNKSWTTTSNNPPKVWKNTIASENGIHIAAGAA